MEEKRKVKIALCGIGLDAYWDQFAGLRSRLESCLASTAAMIEQAGGEVLSLGLVDNSSKARDAGCVVRREGASLLVIHVTTYALSSTLLLMLQRANLPVLLLNLQPDAALDYARVNGFADRRAMTGEWLAYCASCTMPEITNVMQRAGIALRQITGIAGSADVAQELGEWIAAADAVAALREARIGLMGHYYSGMLDIATDLAGVAITFGVEFVEVELEELVRRRREASEQDVLCRVQEFDASFAGCEDCAPAELARAARTSFALDALVAAERLDAMAYYARGSGVAECEDAMSSIIAGATLLTATGIPIAGEYEVKNALAMLILARLGAGGSFTEYYAMDFTLDHVLMGHDGPGHAAMAEGKIRLRPLEVYHGKVGDGLSVEMSVRHGPVTLLAVAEDGRGRYRMVVAEGESVAATCLEIGNTNSHYQFALGARGFVEAWNRAGTAHHCAVGVGHIAGKLAKVASLLGIEMLQIC